MHWTESFEELPHEAGFWSVTTAEDVHTVSRDWQTYSSEVGGVVVAAAGFPIELARAMFIGMDPPKHDRLKALFQARQGRPHPTPQDQQGQREQQDSRRDEQHPDTSRDVQGDGTSVDARGDHQQDDEAAQAG